MANENSSLPELELRSARAREALTDTVATIKQKSNVPERWRLFVARSRQQLHRDPTPLVAMIVIGAAGVAAIIGGTQIGRSSGGHLDPDREPMPLPKFKPAKPDKKHGGYKGTPKFSRKPDKVDAKAEKAQKKADKADARAAKASAKR